MNKTIEKILEKHVQYRGGAGLYEGGPVTHDWVVADKDALTEELNTEVQKAVEDRVRGLVREEMKYPKINSIFKRDMDTEHKLFIIGQFADPETEFLKENDWTFTEKIDGTNIRVMFDGESITFRGRTDNAQIPALLVKHLQDTFLPKLSLFKESFSDGVVLFGEGCGWKIQKGGMGYVNNEKRQDFILFDVKIGDWFLKREDVEGIAGSLGIKVVPVVGHGTIDDAIKLVSKGLKSTYGDFTAEGIVARPTVELKTRGGKRIITKIKNRDFVHLREDKRE